MSLEGVTSRATASVQEESRERVERFLQVTRDFHYHYIGMMLVRKLTLHEAEDLVQNAYMHAYRKLHQLRDERTMSAWIRKILVRMAMNYQSRGKREIATDMTNEDEEAGLLIEDRREKNPLEHLGHEELMKRVVYLRGKLKRIYREVISDFYVRGMQLTEIAVKRDIPLGTVKRRLFTARHALCALLRQKGFDETDYAM